MLSEIRGAYSRGLNSSRLAVLDYAFVGKAIVALCSDYDMIYQANSDKISHLFEPVGDCDIIMARLGIAAWMIMEKNNRRR
jgi:hypothetical protein